MMRSMKGFTLIELMIVVVIIGILAAIAIPNFIAMQNRAKEGSTKANMHTLQLASEDYGVQSDGVYATVLDATHVVNSLPGFDGTNAANFKNPFSGTTGAGAAYELRPTGTQGAPTAVSGIASYADSNNNTYNIKGYGKTAALTLVLTSGQ